MDAQHDLVWLKTNVSYVIIKYSVYEIYKYMSLWHTIRYNTRNGIYVLFFTQMISFIQMSYHYIDEWRTHIRILRMMTCTCVHQSIPELTEFQ